MKVFLSWSGDAGRDFALFLREWLRLVIRAVKPWMSEKDVAKGSSSTAELGAALDGAWFGVVVLSATDQHSPWINFEAGAISKSVGQAEVIPLLLDLAKTDVTGPISQFQAVDAGDKAAPDHQPVRSDRDVPDEVLLLRRLSRRLDSSRTGRDQAVRILRPMTTDRFLREQTRLQSALPLGRLDSDTETGQE